MKQTMHRLLLSCLLAVGIQAVHAQSTSMVPSAMNYQGLLTDTNGNAVAPDSPENHNIEFRLYKDATGGTALWGETQTVTVFKGNFSVVLGNGTSLSGIPSGSTGFVAQFTGASTSDLYFGITPQGGAEFAPRQKILASAFALRARTAESVMQTTGSSTFNSVNITGSSSVSGNNFLQFGAGISGQDANAGKIGYQIYNGALDIVGAGTNNINRTISIYAEGGTTFNGAINFPSYGQYLNLHDPANGLGVQNATVYLRSYDAFAWYRGGSHSDNAQDAGGGTTLATLTNNGLTLGVGKFIGDGSGLTNINPNSLPTNYGHLGITGAGTFELGVGVTKTGSAGVIGYQTYSQGLDIVGAGTLGNNRKISLWAEGGTTCTGGLIINGTLSTNGYNIDHGGAHGVWMGSFGDGHAIGSQNYTTYSRVAVGSDNTHGSFAWYRGGTHTNNEQDPGGGSKLMYLDGNGLTVQGTCNLTSNLSVGGQSININNGGYQIGVGVDFAINRAGVTRAVLFGASGGWSTASDRRLKQDITPVSNALADLMKLKPASYHFKADSKEQRRSFGFIAQEVQPVLPDLVTTMDKAKGTMGLIYDGFIPVTVAAVQEQQKQIETLSTENDELKKRLQALEAKLDRIAGSLPEAPARAAAADTSSRQ